MCQIVLIFKNERTAHTNILLKGRKWDERIHEHSNFMNQNILLPIFLKGILIQCLKELHTQAGTDASTYSNQIEHHGHL